MHGREMTRIMIEGALNGIGFVIGSAVVGWIFLHGSAVLAFAVLVIVLWLIFRNGRHLKTRLETGLTTRHLSQCSLHGRIEGAEKP
jgi:hypothetical protein